MITRETLARLERGSPGVSMSALARVFWVLGEVRFLGDLLNLANDSLAQILVDRGLPKYVRRIPFEITADPFYSESNVRYLKGKLDALNAGILPLETHDLIKAD